MSTEPSEPATDSRPSPTASRSILPTFDGAHIFIAEFEPEAGRPPGPLAGERQPSPEDHLTVLARTPEQALEACREAEPNRQLKALQHAQAGSTIIDGRQLGGGNDG